MNNFEEMEERQKWLDSLLDGVPCDHAGCLQHVSHPCEGCGRIAGMRSASVYWEGERNRINELLRKLQQKPDSEKIGYPLTPAGILNAYREGDVVFNDAVRQLNEWADSRAARSEVQPDNLLIGAIALTDWLRTPGHTGKSRAGRVPARLLENLESAIDAHVSDTERESQ